MKTQLIFLITMCCFVCSIQAQKPFAELGLDNEVEVITLSNGRYIEHVENDTLRQIGSVMFNMNTNKVEYFIPEDDLEKVRIANRDREVSRFMAVDPLAPDYPHNSPYAFSENRVIDGVELEGLEFYFAADGEFIGAWSTSPRIHIISDSEVAMAKREFEKVKQDPNYKSGYLNFYLPDDRNSFNNYYNSNDKKKLKVASDVLTTIYEIGVGKNNLIDGYIRIVNTQDGAVVYGELPIDIVFRLKKNADPNNYSAVDFFGWTPDGYVSMNQFSMDNNFYDLLSTLYHESLHKGGVPGGAWGEFEAHYKATQHSLYDKTSKEFQLSNIRALGDYLSDQLNYVEANPNDANARALYNKNKKLYDKENERFTKAYQETE